MFASYHVHPGMKLKCPSCHISVVDDEKILYSEDPPCSILFLVGVVYFVLEVKYCYKLSDVILVLNLTVSVRFK